LLLPPSPPPAEVAGRSPGDAGGGGSPFPASERAGRGPPLPGGGAHRATWVRRGWVRLAAVPSRRRGSTAATPASACPWTPRPQMGLGGPRWALAGWVLQRFGLAGGGGDDLAGSWDGGSTASALQHGSRCFTGPSGPGRASQGLVCSRCCVRSVTASRRWRWVPPVWLRGCCS
jgi:hypothetical protein